MVKFHPISKRNSKVSSHGDASLLSLMIEALISFVSKNQISSSGCKGCHIRYRSSIKIQRYIHSTQKAVLFGRWLCWRWSFVIREVMNVNSSYKIQELLSYLMLEIHFLRIILRVSWKKRLAKCRNEYILLFILFKHILFTFFFLGNDVFHEEFLCSI
jgi:hypothetical protein